MDSSVIILILTFTTLVLLNVPIAFAIGLSTLIMISSFGGIPAEYVMAQRMSNGLASFPLLAIPFFVLSGVLMGEGGMARRLMDFASAVVGRFHGGLAYVNTLTCMLFGAVSGSATAAVSSVGGFMIPEMERKKYGTEFSTALTTMAATTGLLIPPSNVMIVYAVVAGNVSVAALFLAGVVPGIIMGLLIMGVSFLVLLGSPVDAGETVGLREAGVRMVRAVPSLLLVVLVMGGILSGVFSATEASAISVAYALILGLLVHREIKVRDLPAIVLKAAKTTAVVMILIATSQAMSWALAYEHVPTTVSQAMLGLSSNPIVTLLIINALLLAVGTFMDMTPAVLIFTPIFLPVVTDLGMDPVQFGVIIVANLCIGLCTPPVGTCLFVGCSVGGTTIAKVAKPLLPMFVAALVGLLLFTFFPMLSLWLPRALGV